MCSTKVICPGCGRENISNFGHSDNNVPRYRCRNKDIKKKKTVWFKLTRIFRNVNVKNLL